MVGMPPSILLLMSTSADIPTLQNTCIIIIIIIIITIIIIRFITFFYGLRRLEDHVKKIMLSQPRLNIGVLIISLSI